MPDPKYSIEITHRIYNNGTGTFLQISPDKDGLDPCVITHYIDSKPEAEIIIPWNLARLLGKVLLNEIGDSDNG